MRPVSENFLAAIAGSHNIASRLRAVARGQIGTSPTGGVLLDIISGDVSLDGAAAIRSTIEVEISAVDQATGEPLWPNGSSDTLTPYGAIELFVERGVAFGGGSIEYVSLGYFRIDDVEQSEAPAGPIRISGSDRMANVVDSKLTEPRQYAASEAYSDVLYDLVSEAIPGVIIEWDDIPLALGPIGRSVPVESDRYAFVNELVTGLGKIAYFDHRGVLIVRTPPNPNLPVWAVARGREGVLVSAGRSLSRSGVYNGVVATGEALDTGTPARALAVDNNPNSPTRWGGPFGRVPREFSSPLLTTTAQAQLAAGTVLRRSLGLPYNVNFTAVPNPALEPLDPIAVGIEGAPVPIVPTILAGDSFSRTVVNGVGPGEDGIAWSIGGAGSSTAFSVTTGTLRKTNGSNIAEFLLKPASIGRPDVELRSQVQVPSVAVAGSLIHALVVRYTSGTDHYAARLEFNAGGTVTLKLGDSSAVVTPVVINDFDTYSAGQWWDTLCVSRGSSIYFKAWPSTDPEPNAWSFVYDDARLSGSTENRFGLWWWRVGANSNAGPQWWVDNFRARTVPRSLIRGGELHVLDSLSVPLTADEAMRGTTREQTLVVIETS